MIEAVPELAEIGINALKIEGRMKSASYVATAVSAYRNVLDSLNGSESQIHDAINAGESILQKDFARSKTAFYFDSPEARWLDPQQNGGTGISLGKILAVKGSINSPTKSKWARIHAASLQHGDSIRIHRADDSDRQTQKIQDIEPAGEDVWIPIPEAFTAGDSVYLIQTKENPKHYAPVIPNNDKGFRRKPGFDHAPSVHLNPLEKLHRLPEGLYAAVSRIEDLYIVQSVRPVKVFVHLNRSTAPALLKNLPFSPAEIVPMLDPYFPQKDESALAPEIQSLLDYGYRYFAVNNPGHFSYFRGTDAILIAGPYLYSFNRYAASFISRLGASYLVTPLEQNRQNVERTFGQSERNRIFVTVFAYPALFRIRADLSSIYRFNAFSDNREAHFQLLPSPDGSVVLPERPFSILDKIHFLQESGFSHFLIDLQGPHLKKVDYKDLMAAAHGNKAIPDISRFNWKDGFYQVKDD
ncbi:hypothetical protein FACS1894164_13800 [Spirochaetia bacterium]|nr:hypothetical protein FACS1894164_13800 [Spirochaetia bacterium]